MIEWRFSAVITVAVVCLIECGCGDRHSQYTSVGNARQATMVHASRPHISTGGDPLSTPTSAIVTGPDWLLATGKAVDLIGKRKDAAAKALGPPALAWDGSGETIYRYGPSKNEEMEGEALEFAPNGPMVCVEGYAGTDGDNSFGDLKQFPPASDVWTVIHGDPKGPTKLWAYDRDTALLQQDNNYKGSIPLVYFLCGRTANGLIVSLQAHSTENFPYQTEKTFSTKTDSYTYKMVPDASFNWRTVRILNVCVHKPGVTWLCSDNQPRQADPGNVTWTGHAYPLPPP